MIEVRLAVAWFAVQSPDTDPHRTVPEADVVVAQLTVTSRFTRSVR